MYELFEMWNCCEGYALCSPDLKVEQPIWRRARLVRVNVPISDGVDEA